VSSGRSITLVHVPSSNETTKVAEARRLDARTFVWRSLAAKAQSVAEIEEKLGARGVDADETTRVIADAVRLGFLDDVELAGQLARGFRARGYGRRRAARTLARRGIPAALATGALEDAYGTGVDAELELAHRALGGRAVDGDAARRRAVGFLVRRGFSVGVAWRVVRCARPP
jgi:regulatory protein